MAESDFMDRLTYAKQNAPQRDGLAGLMAPVLWAMGIPHGGPNLNEYFYKQAIGRGQNPYETLPWLKGGSTGGAVQSKDPLADMPEWYRKWYEAQGRYGRVTPVRGLL